MAEKMEGEVLNEFLMAGTRTAKIAGVKSDASPIVSPVWFIMDAGDVLFTTMCTSLKYKIIQRDPRVSICVDEENIAYAAFTPSLQPLAFIAAFATLAAFFYLAFSVGGYNDAISKLVYGLLKIRVKDMADFNKLHGERLIALPGVRQTRTFFVMKEVIDNVPLAF